MEQQNRALPGPEVRSQRGKKPRAKMRNREKGIPHKTRSKKGDPDPRRRRQGLGAERRREATDGRRF